MVLAIDTSNIFFITWSMFKKDIIEKNGEDYIIQEEDTGLFMHMFFRKIMDYITSYKEVVLCYEGKGSTKWRKEQWPPYKENRVKDDPNYKWVGPLMEKCYSFFENLHVKQLKVDNCEGDDCIYATCKYYAEKGEPVRIISNDKDLSQIMNFYPELVTQFNPIKKENIKKNENILLEKCIIGDASDNIKPFRGIGPKTFEKMLTDKVLWSKKMTPENLKILEQVEKIVDLRKYPQEYQDAIRDELDKPWNKLDRDSVEKFFIDNGLKSCYNDWSNTWLPDIQSQDFEQPDAMDEIMDILRG